MSFVSKALSNLDSLVDWFIPPSIACDKEKRKQARLFLISHLLGPFIGNTVPAALYYFDPQPGPYIAILAISITGFWVFPLVLKAFGHYNLLALVSIQNLIFCILWSCYFIGGVTSPTLPWVLTIPLLAFFYVGNSASMRLSVLTIFAVNVAAFVVIYNLYPLPPVRMALAEVQGLGIVSTVGAALYVIMMSVYYGKALSSQMELEAAMRGHMATSVELREAAADAERANLAKSEFLAKMSHELRTPLNAVIGYSQILLEEAEDDGDDEIVGDLEKIHAAGYHLLKLVNNVLDLSKIEAGHMEVSTEEFHFGSMVQAVADSLSASAAKNGNAIHVTIAPDVGIAIADLPKVRSALTHVLENAIKYTEHGRIDLSCATRQAPTGDVFEIRVADTGIGIDEQYLPTLFKQFAVGDDQSSTKYGGTGVGLALTRKLCRLMGGDVTVETELGKGSTFTLIIPTEYSNMESTPTPQALAA